MEPQELVLARGYYKLRPRWVHVHASNFSLSAPSYSVLEGVTEIGSRSLAYLSITINLDPSKE
jgi:hypothetical protein